MIDNLYLHLCKKLGKAGLWSMNIDELCDYLDENYEINEK
jgi:hypothetical protein